MIELSADKVYYFFDPKIEPVLTVDSGEIVRVETLDSASGFVRTEKDIINYAPDELEKRGIEGADPVTGPISVRGAEPGDCLSIEIKELNYLGLKAEGSRNP